jgi:nucleoside-diphosphate-sugar epimerase
MKKNRAVITGVSSFVGMHLASTFSNVGWDVTGIISKPFESYDGIRAKRLEKLIGEVSFVTSDLLDTIAIKQVIDDCQPDLWIQHAGYTENYGSLDYNLQKSLALNVLSLEPLYQHLAGNECGVIITGSSMEYSFCDLANKEKDSCWPETPYGVSKLAESIEANRLAIQHGIPTRVARLYIPVGTFDSPGKLIDSVMGALHQNEIVDLSPCSQKRDFLGVSDIAEAYLKLADDFPRQLFDVFNVCSGETKSLIEFLKDLCRITKSDEALLNFGARKMRAGEPQISYGDNSKARLILDWHPRPLDEILKTLLIIEAR